MAEDEALFGLDVLPGGDRLAGEGGPNYATETLPIMIYRYSMKKFNVGAASALSTMMFTVMTILFVFYYRKREKINSQAG